MVATLIRTAEETDPVMAASVALAFVTAINLLINKSPTPSGGFDKPLTKAQVLAAAGPLIKP